MVRPHLPPDPAWTTAEGEIGDAACFECDVDISPTLSQLRIPAVLIYGETDRWVPIEPSIQAWRTALNSGHACLSVSRLPGRGHFSTLATDPADHDEAGPISPAYEQLLADWLCTVALPG